MTSQPKQRTGEPREALVVAAPVTEVTLLEDRAHVVRQATVTVAAPAGGALVRIDDVAPVINDKTLLVTLAPAATGARVVDARVRRRAVVRVDTGDAPADSRAALVDELLELDSQLDERRAQARILGQRAAGLERVADLALDELASDVSWGREVGTDWAERLDQLGGNERGVRTELIVLEREIRELDRHRARLQRRIELFDSPAEREAASIEVELLVEAAGEVGLRLEYLVPNACWRPYHTATLTTPGSPSAIPDGSIGTDEADAAGEQPEPTEPTPPTAVVAFRSEGCVWQNTGEDWDSAQLTFSTERASLGIEPPELSSDVLRVQRKRDRVHVEQREQTVDTTGLGRAASAGPAELPGIDDGGDVIELRAAGPSSIPSDGKPYRVPLAHFESDADCELLAIGELTPCVLLKSTQTHAGKRPILAGPVDLIRDSGFVGRTSVLFIAPGERFEIGWGPEPELRLKRDVERHEQKSRMLSSWLTERHEVAVRLSNLGAAPRRVVVTERVPVAEIEKVKIEMDEKRTTEGQLPDDDGFVRWEAQLEPFGHQKLELVYRLRKHDDVVGI